MQYGFSTTSVVKREPVRREWVGRCFKPSSFSGDMIIGRASTQAEKSKLNRKILVMNDKVILFVNYLSINMGKLNSAEMLDRTSNYKIQWHFFLSTISN